jgi:hypothetical protein
MPSNIKGLPVSIRNIKELNKERKMDSLYWDFAKNIKDKLSNDINGRIVFEIYKDIDTVIFKVFFKDFEYSYAVNNVQDRIYSGSVEEIPEAFKKAYMSSIKKAFFKTECHKRRDERAKMEIEG